MAKRWSVYFAGLVLLALGITLNTKTGLGVSPIISVPYGVSETWGLNLGDMTFLFYALFVVAQMVLHIRIWRKIPDEIRFFSIRTILIKDALQLPFSLLFTRLLNLFSFVLPDLSTGMDGMFLGTIWGRLAVLIAAIILTGVGAAMSLDMRLVPNSGDGMIQAISDTTGKSLAFVKNYFDLCNICIAIVIGLVFAGHLVGLGIGTVLAVVGVGRSIALFHRFFRAKLESITIPTASAV